MVMRRSVLLGLSAMPIMVRAQEAMPISGKRTWAAVIPAIRVGLPGGENDADRLARYAAYRALLEDTFQVPASMLLTTYYAGVISAFAAKRVEIANMSPAAYAAAWLASNRDVEPLVVAEEADGSTSYDSVLFVRADSGIISLEQMKRRSLAWTDPNSASGYLIPRAEFVARGIDPDTYFGHTGFTGGHEQSVVAVLDRRYDAGLTWTSGLGDQSKGYTRGVLRSMVDKGRLDMRDLRIIWRSGPIKNGPLTVRKSTPAEFRDDMLAFHLALPRLHPDIYYVMALGTSKGWIPAQPSDYRVFIDLLRRKATNRSL